VKRVRAGAELCIDYALFVEGRYTRQLRERYACHCGAPDCRGTMLARRGRQSGKKHRPAAAGRVVEDSVHANMAVRTATHAQTTMTDILIDA